ncbi:MAG: hypothetical protein GOV00_01140 [Candidatus Altiarchaeota archaeon]|nr:hypothetical protein [Candidatus Altiarchaeota archaeon]
MDKVQEVAKKIKALEIQGATNVALNALEAVGGFVNRNPGKSVDEVVALLLATRPTEPLMINTLNYLKRVKLDEVPHNVEKFVNGINEGMDKIVNIGANLVRDGMTVQTICHSSTVVKILLKARFNGKNITVVNTETRPRYQGRKTAKALYKGGINVKHYVDSAIMKAMKDERVDLCLIGLDAILMDGRVVNKIGSGLLAMAAEDKSVPFYACGHSLKLDKESLFAKNVAIEERDPREVWDYPIEVKNPAFESVPAKRLRGIITELGILPPAIAGFEIMEKMSEIFST